MTAVPDLAQLRRTARRGARRAAFRGVNLYLGGLGVRGRITRAEAVSMRLVLARWLAKDAFRPDPDVIVIPVRERHADGQVRGEWVEAPGAGPRQDGVLLYVHGGAFVACSPETHRGLTAELSARTGRPVFSLDYRLAPEYSFPAAVQDTVRAWSWLLDAGIDPSRMVVAGDSAGGHLSLGMPPAVARAGLPTPAGVVAFSPVVDLSLGVTKGRAGMSFDPIGSNASGAAAVLRAYHRDQDHPDLDITRPDSLAAMPPVLLQASENELLTPDAYHYANALTAAGGDIDLQTWPRQAHVFQIAHRLVPAARDALAEVAAFVDRVSPRPA